MKHKHVFVGCACWALLLSVALGADSPAPPAEKPGWKLAFQDEFDRPQLNDMYWFAAYRSGRKEYKCIFNHELLIISHQKDNSPQHIQSFVEKLKDTDVDAVMCCPTAWRTNLFPSEVDPSWKKYQPGQPLSKFRSYDYIMRYLHAGGDPVRETLEACRKWKKAFFISYRMNDGHYMQDVSWPTHNAFWREHPQYWLGNADAAGSGGRDNTRVFNYMHPEVREHYSAILKELCTNYDVDGVELDFQRHARFFHDAEMEPGAKVMTAFVQRTKEMLNQIGRQRGKSLALCVRVPETLAKCQAAGLDVAGWDALGLVDMVNVSSSYYQTIELGIEEFKANTKRARVYGEMNYVTAQSGKDKFARRYMTAEGYRAAALNLLSRGADGLSFFNFDYVPAKQRLPMTEVLKKITDVEFLRTVSKHYVVTPRFGSLPAKNEKTIRLAIPDDAKKAAFQRAVLRVETAKSCADLTIGVWLNGKRLESCPHKYPELFPPLAQNEGYAARDALKFFAIPLDALNSGRNEVRISNLDAKKAACTFSSLEIAIYR